MTTARMETLRSPKHLPGVALGIPSLTFRAWYEARSGAAAWDALYKIPNADWQDYLSWIRRVLHCPRRTAWNCCASSRAAGCWRRCCGEAGVERVQLIRRLVLATGRGGTGGFSVPEGIDPGLLPDLAAHGGAPVDFAALRGRRIAVIGGGPTAWDNAATALEAGAARVDMFVRRAALPQVNKGRGSAHPGFFEGWATLPPAEKWRILSYMHDLQSPPPHEFDPPRAAAAGLPHPSRHAGAAARRGTGRRCGWTSAAAPPPRRISSSSAPATASTSRASPNSRRSPRASPPGPTASPRRRVRRGRSSRASPGWGRGSS